MNHSSVAAILATLALSATPTHADAPDSALNPATGYIETVHAEWNGSDHDVELTIDRGWLGPLTHSVLPGPTEDVGPRLSISSAGAVTTVWTRDDATDQVLARLTVDGSVPDVACLVIPGFSRPNNPASHRCPQRCGLVRCHRHLRCFVPVLQLGHHGLLESRTITPLDGAAPPKNYVSAGLQPCQPPLP